MEKGEKMKHILLGHGFIIPSFKTTFYLSGACYLSCHNALAGTPLCQYKVEEFQKFLQEIQISKLKFVPFICQEEG